MLNVVLFEPEIPPNTGNIIRLCANSGAHLHLIHPLGFTLDEKSLRRAGLDYRDLTEVTEHANFNEFINKAQPQRVFACTTKAQQHHNQPSYQDNDFLLFGPETRGLPDDILSQFKAEDKIRIPMRAASRSLNLSNACAIILFEAWRQQGFMGHN